MGALCGKEDHFDALERHGKGNKLSSGAASSSAAAPTSISAAATAGKTAASNGAPKSVSTSPPQRLGGGSTGGGTAAAASAEDAAARREAMLAAAEARNKAVSPPNRCAYPSEWVTNCIITSSQSATRGTKPGGGGKLTQQLERQAKDGGRAEEARREAERKGNGPLVVSALLRPCSLALANFERGHSGIEASHLSAARVVYRDRAIPPLHIPRLRSSIASAVDAPNLLLRQAELPSSPLARRAANPSLPLVGPFRLPLLLERERLAPHPDRALLGALAKPGRIVARLGPLQVGGVLTLAEQARRVLRQGRVALEGFRGGDREFAQEVGEGGGPARRERLNQRRKVRVEFRQLPVSNERASAVLREHGLHSPEKGGRTSLPLAPLPASGGLQRP